MGVTAMPSGGGRVRSGPQPDPKSGRSEKRGIKDGLTAIDPRPFTGAPPTWPLSPPEAREVDLWRKIWKYPQARIWKGQAWRYVTLAMYVRSLAEAEKPGATASARNGIAKQEAELGISATGLVQNGWRFAEETPAPEKKQPRRNVRASEGSKNDPATGGRPRRLRAVS
jgi:hypothetical protein